MPSTLWSPSVKTPLVNAFHSRLSKVLANVRCTGGTNLSLGIQAGFDELRSVGQASLLSRAIFLTDMESGQDDEARVIKGENKSRPFFLA
jgi:hypothetical protein